MPDKPHRPAMVVPHGVDPVRGAALWGGLIATGFWIIRAASSYLPPSALSMASRANCLRSGCANACPPRADGLGWGGAGGLRPASMLRSPLGLFLGAALGVRRRGPCDLFAVSWVVDGAVISALALRQIAVRPAM